MSIWRFMATGGGITLVWYGLLFVNRAGGADLPGNVFGSSSVVTATSGSLFVETNTLGCDAAALMLAVQSGGYYTFGCDGTIILTNSLTVVNNLSLDAAGYNVTISGYGSNRLFRVNPGVRCRMAGLRLTDGRADMGGAIFVDGGTLELNQVTFRGNQAVGRSPTGSPVANLGGAVFNTNGRVRATQCYWEDNAAVGGHAGVVFVGYYLRIGATDGSGGAIYNVGGVVQCKDCVFSSNHATGGFGVNGSGGVNIGRDGIGGAIFNNSDIILENCTFSLNSAIGGQSGGPDVGGFGANGNGYGGAIATVGRTYCRNATFYSNRVQGGAIPFAHVGVILPGRGYGGAIYSPTGDVSLTHVTVSRNEAAAVDNSMARGGGIYAVGSEVHLINSILANSISGSNCFGVLIDDGHNISSDASCNFTNVGSLNNTDSRLGPLADNGGPTPTLVLLPGSPAINAADDTACATMDQRGVSRPQFGKCDIGAFEARLTDLPPVLVAPVPSAQIVTLLLHGAPGAEYRLQSSSGLANWSSIATNVADKSGATSFSVPTNSAAQFYRAIMP